MFDITPLISKSSIKFVRKMIHIFDIYNESCFKKNAHISIRTQPSYLKDKDIIGDEQDNKKNKIEIIRDINILIIKCEQLIKICLVNKDKRRSKK